MSNIVGVGGDVHDSNVAKVGLDGVIKFAASEERFSRIKKDGTFPYAGLGVTGTRNIVVAAQEKESARQAFMSQKIKMPNRFLDRLDFYDGLDIMGRVGHHESHAASAYYTSGFNNATIITMDGGSIFEPWCTTVSRGTNEELVNILNDTRMFTDWYFFTTALLGFTPNKHEGKVTGLAAHGSYNYEFADFLLGATENKTNLSYEISDWENLEDRTKNPRLVLNNPVLSEYVSKFRHISKEDLANTVQVLTENQVIEYLSKTTDVTGNLALAGGLFANVRLNQKIKEMGYDQIFIHPAMGDEGLGLGAALHHLGGTPRQLDNIYFGNEFSDNDIKNVLDLNSIEYELMKNPSKEIAQLLSIGKVVAHFSGRMEYGPRALGNRSILYQTTDKSVNDWLNKRLKRTEFMPFAPATLMEYASDCYNGMNGTEYAAQFMTITFDTTDEMKVMSPGVIHIDGTARPQIVNQSTNPEYYQIIDEYRQLTGIPSIINTSFNNHGEPIVCSPTDAIKSFIDGNLDALAIGSYLVIR